MQEVIKRNWGVLLIIAVVVALWYWPRSNSSVSNISEYTNKIDSLQSKIDSITTLRNDLDQRIDTVTIIIEKIRIKYEKDNTVIINNTTNEDYKFFLQYIGDNTARLDSICNL